MNKELQSLLTNLEKFIYQSEKYTFTLDAHQVHLILDHIANQGEKIERLNNIITELEKELDNLIIFNQSNINCNHYTPDDWKDSKLIGDMLYKMKPVSFLAQELKDKLKALKEGK